MLFNCFISCVYVFEGNSKCVYVLVMCTRIPVIFLSLNCYTFVGRCPAIVKGTFV